MNGPTKILLMILILLLLKGSAAILPLPGDQGVPVLVYHHLLPEQENRYFKDNNAVISVEAFSEQMKYLHDNHYKTLTLEELEGYLNGAIPLPEKCVLITFDDGYLSNFEYAYPIMKPYQFRGVIFAITGNIRSEKESFDADQLNFISLPEIPLYSDVFQIEGHSHQFHYNPFHLSFLVWKPSGEILRDLMASQKMLPSRYFAYPFGQYTKRTKTLVREAGYEMAFTIYGERVYRRSNKMELGRYWVDPNMTLEQFADILERD